MVAGDRSFLEAETQLQGHLVVRDLAVDHVAACFHHLEPFDMSQRPRRGLDGIADGIVGAGGRRPDQLDVFVDVVARDGLLTRVASSMAGSMDRRGHPPVIRDVAGR